MLTLFRDTEHELEFRLLESGSGSEELKNLAAVTNLVRRDMEGWGPFDFMYTDQGNR